MRSRIRTATIAVAFLTIAAAVLAMRAVGFARENESRLVVSPIAPRVGEHIKIQYRPDVASFERAKRLILRGRLRTPQNAMYSSGTTVKTLAILDRGDDGVFRGGFVLPDSVVYVAMVVEDSLATVVDDRNGLLWAVSVHDVDGKPTLDALTQRQNDFMGRSWEEAYSAAKLNAQLHPQYVVVWNNLEFFERALLGDAAADSLAADRRAMIDLLIRGDSSAAQTPSTELSAIVWRSYVKHDSTAFKYWYDRLRREAPHDPQVAQMATVRLARQFQTTAPQTLLDSLERLWATVAPVSGPGNMIISTGRQVARNLGDDKAFLRWVERGSGEDSLFRTGVALASFAPTRENGMDRIRAALRQSPNDFAADRPLTLNNTEYRRVLADRRRELLAALGEALIAAHKPREGLDTLSLAVSDGWNVQLLRRVASQQMMLGDTSGALAVEAKISVDPRTSRAHVDSISRLAVARLGPNPWADARANAQKQMVREVMNDAQQRNIPGDPTVVNTAREVQHLKSLTAGHPSVVVYWSRHCGAALEALPTIDSVGQSLHRRGIAAYLIADEPPSAETAKFFREHMIKMPILYDSRMEVSSALRNFGTPAYYVLDEQGRIRFDQVDEVNDLLLQVAVIDAESKSPRHMSAKSSSPPGIGMAIAP
ncbi:MAG: TlpA disulfide reductase family protein [Gemmatimonadaceae bacterium]